MFGPPPVTLSALVDDLRRLGVSTGDTLLVHSSLRSLGAWVCGGPTAVVSALLRALGPTGNLIVPAQSPECQDPSRWSHRTVPPEWWPAIREQLPPFDPAITPSATVGVIAERVRTWPGAVRSPHPITSFAGIGPDAHALLDEHALPSLLGERSPLARLEAAGARILLLGVGYDRCTGWHLAEYRLPAPAPLTTSCLVSGEHGREWIQFETIELDASEFRLIGSDLENSVDWIRTGRVAAAEARLLPLRESVRYAQQWLSQRRLPSSSHPASATRAATTATAPPATTATAPSAIPAAAPAVAGCP
jgi:aminoglycoside 3-N-acetyltransferase